MYNIGILQLTQNLDDAVRGFKSGLAEQNISAKFHYLNADGNAADLPKFAKQLADLNVDIIFACSTPAALAAVELDKNIPVIFTPVFDPVGAGLTKSLEQPGGKATGVAGMVPSAAKIAFIQELLPDASTIGVVYHTEDSNSVLETKNFLKAAEGHFHIVKIPVNRPEDLSNLPEMLASNLDALFIPIGRIIEENFASVVYYADSINLPIISSHAPNVPAGALGALVANHYQLGVACAEKAAQILSGATPATIPVGIVEKPDILLNAFVAENLGITLPQDLVAKASEIFE